MTTIHSPRKELLAVPHENPSEYQSRWYRSLLIVPTRLKHDSGWMVMAILGVNEKDEVVARIGMADDIEWPQFETYRAYRTDMTYPAGVMRIWSNSYDFRASWGSSSTIELRKRDTK